MTVADLEMMPDDGHRDELIDGALLVTPRRACGTRSCVQICSTSSMVNALTASDPETAEHLRAKYTAARVVLLEAVARHGWDLGDGPLGAVAP